MHAIDGEERRKRALVVVGDERREHDGRTPVQFRRANRREFILGAEMRPSGRGFPRKNQDVERGGDDAARHLVVRRRRRGRALMRHREKRSAALPAANGAAANARATTPRPRTPPSPLPSRRPRRGLCPAEAAREAPAPSRPTSPVAPRWFRPSKRRRPRRTSRARDRHRPSPGSPSPSTPRRGHDSRPRPDSRRGDDSRPRHDSRPRPNPHPRRVRGRDVDRRRLQRRERRVQPTLGGGVRRRETLHGDARVPRPPRRERTHGVRVALAAEEYERERAHPCGGAKAKSTISGRSGYGPGFGPRPHGSRRYACSAGGPAAASNTRRVPSERRTTRCASLDGCHAARRTRTDGVSFELLLEDGDAVTTGSGIRVGVGAETRLGGEVRVSEGDDGEGGGWRGAGGGLRASQAADGGEVAGGAHGHDAGFEVDSRGGAERPHGRL